MFGLDTDTIRNIKQAFAKIPDIDKVILYGSRAKGNYRNGSDIDITLFGEKLTLDNSVYPLMDELEELYLPYMFDISIFADIDSEDLVEHIHRAGKVFYQKEVDNGKLKIESVEWEERGLPKGWEVKKLGDVCEVSTGKSNANQAVSNGQYAFFDRSKKTKRSNRYLFDCDALIIPGEGAKFFPKHYFGKFDLHQRAYAIFNFNKDVNINFIEYYLIFEHKYFERVAVGATVKSLRLRHFKELQIPLPPLPEQKRIVAILDQAFTTIASAKANAEQNLKNARELFQSKLQTEFANGKLKIESGEWQEKKLGDVCDLITCGVAKRPQYVENGIPFLSARNVKEGRIIWNNYKYISEKTHNELTKNNKPLKGDILYTRVGSFGEAAVIESDKEFSVFVSLTLIKPNQSFTNKYFLKYYLNSEHVKKLAKNSISGSGVGNLNVGTVRKFKIPLPSLPEQKTMVKKLDALSTETQKLETIYQQKIDDLDELKKSILQKAFSGEL